MAMIRTITDLWRVGAALAPGVIELIAREVPGLDPERLVTTGATHVARASTDVPGHLVLVDLEPAEPSGARAATFVRELEPPHPIDVARFEAAAAAFARAKVPALVRKPAVDALRAAFAELAGGSATQQARHAHLPWDPRDYLTRIFLDRANERAEVFPTTWWHDDPSAGIDEMIGLLKLHRVPDKLPRDRLVAEAVRELDRIVDENAARDALSARLCELANELLARSTDRRFCGPFYSDFNGGEPNWLLTTPARFDALIAEQLLIRWDPQLRVPAPRSTYIRLPDRGEIDFDNFPSGDDPF